MSKTDKDAPYWVRAKWHVPVHDECPLDRLWGCLLEQRWILRRHRYTWGPRPIDRRLYYWKPDRARVRAASDQARKEYNTFGLTEVEVPAFQHRHAETIGGGYWD